MNEAILRLFDAMMDRAYEDANIEGFEVKYEGYTYSQDEAQAFIDELKVILSNR